MLTNLLLLFSFLFSSFAFAADPVIPSEIDMSKYACTNDREVYGRVKCDKFKATVIERLEKKVSHMIYNFKTKGSLYRYAPKAGFCVAQREPGVDAKCDLPIADKLGGDSAPGSFCDISKDDGLIESTCVNENAYSRGGAVQIQIQYLEDIENEIKAGSLKIHGQHGSPDSKPCASLALALIRGYDGYEEAGVKHKGIIEAEKNVDKLLQSKASLTKASDDSKVCRQSTAQLQDTKLGEKTQLVETKSNAVCTLSFAHSQMQTIFEELVACEWKTRAEEDNPTFVLPSTQGQYLSCTMDAEHDSYEDEDQGSNQWWDEAWHWVSKWVSVFRPNKALQKLKDCYKRNLDRLITDDLKANTRASDPKKLQPYKAMPPFKDKDGHEVKEFPPCTDQANNFSPSLLFGVGMMGMFRRRKRFTALSLLMASSAFAGNDVAKIFQSRKAKCDDGSLSKENINYYYKNGTDGEASLCGHIKDGMTTHHAIFRPHSNAKHSAAVLCCIYGETKAIKTIIKLITVNKYGSCAELNDSEGFYRGIALSGQQLNEWGLGNGDMSTEKKYPFAIAIEETFKRYNPNGCKCSSNVYKAEHATECGENDPLTTFTPTTALAPFTSTMQDLNEIVGDGNSLANENTKSDVGKGNVDENSNAATAGGIRDGISSNAKNSKNKHDKAPESSGGKGSVAGGGSVGDAGLNSSAGYAKSDLTGSSATENASTGSEKDSKVEYGSGGKAIGGSGKKGSLGGIDTGHNDGLSAANFGQGATGPGVDVSGGDDYFNMAGNLGLFERVNKKYDTVGNKIVNDTARDEFNRLRAN